MSTLQKTTDQFIIEHEFNAPKKMVFNAFGDADALGEWWGPVECVNTVLKLDFRPGGVFHYKMEQHGKASYGRFIFGNIQPYDLLEFTNAFSDENANVVKAPFDIQLPLEIFYQLHFSEKNGKTTIRLTGQPVKASKEEQAVFHSINSSMQEGFGATFKLLQRYLNAQFKLRNEFKAENKDTGQ